MANAVLAGDDRIDVLSVALEERAYALVAQQAPVAADLRFLMSSLRVMADYEKTGDRAVAVAKSSLAVSYMLTGDPSALAAEIR